MVVHTRIVCVVYVCVVRMVKYSDLTGLRLDTNKRLSGFGCWFGLVLSVYMDVKFQMRPVWNADERFFKG